MQPEVIHPLDQDLLEMFASKGRRSGSEVAQAGPANAVKVRRVMQILGDLARSTGGALRILDLACGEGVYSIEAGLRETEILAVDGRMERMADGVRAAKRLGLKNVRFEQRDVREVTALSHGQFDVILCLGILYHLDVPDVFRVVENLHEMCRQMIIIDTHICVNPWAETEHKGRTYEGSRYREHGDCDTDSVRRHRLLASLDNTLSFWFTRKSLVQLLCATGFTSVLECHAPLEALKPEDRVTLVATKGTRVQISTYPWVNATSEEEVERMLRLFQPVEAGQSGDESGSIRGRIRKAVNRVLRPLGCQIIRV